MDYNKEMLEIMKQLERHMDQMADATQGSERALASMKNQYKGVGDESQKTESGVKSLTDAVKDFGGVGASIFGNVESIMGSFGKTAETAVTSIGKNALKAIPVVGNIFSVLESGASIVSSIIGLFDSKPIVSQAEAIESAYESAMKEVSSMAGIQLTQVSNTDQLISRMETLAGKTEWTVSEQSEYNGLLSTLEDRLPEVVDMLKDQNGEYDTQLGLLRNINKEQGAKIFNEYIQEEEEASRKKVDDLRDNYLDVKGENSTNIVNTKLAMRNSDYGKMLSWIESSMRQQMGTDIPLKERNALIEEAQELFRNSDDINKFYESDFWNQSSLSKVDPYAIFSSFTDGNEGNTMIYDTVTGNMKTLEEGYAGQEQDIIDYQGAIDTALQDFVNAQNSYSNRDYVLPAADRLLENYRVLAMAGVDMELDESTKGMLRDAGIAVTEDFHATKGTNEDYYHDSQASDIFISSMNAQDSEEAMGFINGLAAFQNIADYLNNKQVDSTLLTSSMIDMKAYLPENVDIDTPKDLTMDQLNGMVEQYIADNSGTIEMLRDNALVTSDILSSMEGRDDELDFWNQEAVGRLDELLQKDLDVDVTVTGTLLDVFSGDVNVETETSGKSDGKKNNALGTSYYSGGLTWVGEHGPELMDLPTGSKIYSNSTSKNMSARNGVIITGNTFNVREEADIEKIAAQLVEKLEETIFNMP